MPYHYETLSYLVRYEVLMAASLKMAVLWNDAVCGLIDNGHLEKKQVKPLT
jgi:hypothetical protein